MEATQDTGIQTLLGSKQSDQFGDFYLARGLDGALYRQNVATKDLFLLVPSGDWEMVSEEALDSMEMTSNQEGIDNLLGKKILLKDIYPSTHISEKLLEIGMSNRGLEIIEEDKLINELPNPLADPYMNSTLQEDASLMPPDDNRENLKTFLEDNTDKLVEELQK